MTKAPFTMEQTWLACINCGHKTDLLLERKFRCPKCGDLYDVQHEFVEDVTAHATFEFRAAPSASPLHRSGVWRFHELIMPYLPEEAIVTLGEGLMPIVPAGSRLREWIGGDLDLWVILEGQNPTGSFKDCGMTVLASIAKAAGVKVIACASTGDTSASAKAYAAAAGMQCIVLLPRGKVTPAQIAQLAGATVIMIPGDFDHCMRIMQDLVTHHGVYPANSLNPTRIEGHQATVFLTAQFFNWRLPNWFVVPVGNGSNASSIGKGIRLLASSEIVARGSRILGCQSEAARSLAEAWNVARGQGEISAASWKAAFKPIPLGETTATAARISDPVSRDKVIREVIASRGSMEIASEADLNHGMHVAFSDGLPVCPQTGIALAGLRNAVRKGTVEPGERVVVVSTATNLKFTDTIAPRESDIVHAPDCETATVARIIGM